MESLFHDFLYGMKKIFQLPRAPLAKPEQPATERDTREVRNLSVPYEEKSMPSGPKEIVAEIIVIPDSITTKKRVRTNQQRSLQTKFCQTLEKRTTTTTSGLHSL